MMTMENAAFATDMSDAPRVTGWLTLTERVGNALPDPAMLFVGMIVLLKKPPFLTRWGLRGII